MLERLQTFLCALLLGLLLVGCETVSDNVVAKATGGVVLDLAVKDAETTLLWVQSEEDAGRLVPADAILARQCPNAVIALDALRAAVTASLDNSDGFKGLIYFGTLKKFSMGTQNDLVAKLQEVVTACAGLIPLDRLLQWQLRFVKSDSRLIL